MVCKRKGKTGKECKCMKGFEKDPKNPNRCKDKDECKGGGGGCDANASCENVEGGSICRCKEGFEVRHFEFEI